MSLLEIFLFCIIGLLLAGIVHAQLKLKANTAMAIYLANPDSRYAVNALSNSQKVSAVIERPMELKWITHPTKEMQLAAVSRFGVAIECVEDPDLDVQLAAVKQYGQAIRYIKAPCKEVQIAAVTQDVDALGAIANPDRDVYMAAIRRSGRAIAYVNNPDPEMQLLAAGNDAMNITSIESPTLDVQVMVLKSKHGRLAYGRYPYKFNIAELEKSHPVLCQRLLILSAFDVDDDIFCESMNGRGQLVEDSNLPQVELPEL